MADRAKKSGVSFTTLCAHSSLALSKVWMGLWDILRRGGKRSEGKTNKDRKIVGPRM